MPASTAAPGAPLIRAELPEVGISPPSVDVDITVPVDDHFDATFCLIRHGIGDAGHNDFAVVVRLVMPW
jgi:hypothetical protein